MLGKKPPSRSIGLGGVNELGEQVIELVPLNEDFPSLRSDYTPLFIIGTMMEHRRYRKTR